MPAADGTAKDVKSAGRTVEVLEYLADRHGEPTRLTDVATALGVPRSSTHALLRTLVNSGWVETDSSGTFYRLGIRLLTTGTAFLDYDPLVRLARPVLLDLATQLNETVHLARVDGDRMIYLNTQESHHEVRTISRVGRSLPTYATSLGKAVLAERPDLIPTDLRPLTPETIVDAERLRADLTETRQRGYAIDRQENTPGLQCYGFALRYTNPVTDAISCSVPLARLDADLEHRVVTLLSAARHRIEESAPRVSTA